MSAGRGRDQTAPGAVLAAALALVLWFTPHSASAQTSEHAVRDSAQVRSQRTFDHERHESISCRSCHGTGSNHRTYLVQTAFDCASCHHDAKRTQTCVSCHRGGPPARTVAASMRLSVWDSARSRVLPFAHETHGRVACTDCHQTAVTLARKRECGSCHESHHRAEATCSTCHVQVPERAHKESVHLSCAGAGCHAPAVAPPPTLSRTLCLTCHQKQTTHEPANACAQCHRMSARAHALKAVRQ